MFAKYNPFDVAVTLDVTVNKDDVISFNCEENNIYVDWGDYSAPNNAKSHTYDKSYQYIITIKSKVSNFIYTSEDKNTLTGITLNKIISIADEGFKECDKLLSIASAENASLLTIGKQAFDSCDMLQQVEIPSTITSIEERAFSLCDQLVDVSVATNNANSSSLDIGK